IKVTVHFTQTNTIITAAGKTYYINVYSRSEQLPLNTGLLCMGHGPLCCCCFANNVRHMILVLISICISALFANLILFNFTAVLDAELPTSLRPVPSLDTLHEYTIWPDRRKRSASSKNDTLHSSTKSSEGDVGYPVLPETVSSVTTSSAISSAMIKKTEKPIMVFVSNSPIKLNATTTTMPSPLPGDPRDVVRNEVQRAIDRLEGRGEDPRTTVADKGSVNDEITAKPSMETKTKRYLLYAAPGLGCLIGLIPMIFLVKHWGSRITISAALANSAVLTLILPALSSYGFSTLFPVRVLLGVCFSPSLPVVGAVAANWGCLNEQLLFTTTTFAFIQLAPVMSWPITMLLFSNEFPLYGIYAIHSTVTLALAFLFAIFHRDRPQHHPWVNGLELNRIVAGKVQELKSNRAQSGACPTLMRSLAAWSLWVGIFGIFFAIAMISTFIPSILSCQDVFMVDYLGVYSILPFTLVPLVMLLGGLVNWWSCCSSTAHVRVWNSVGSGLTAIFFMTLPILFQLQSPSVNVYLLMLSLAPLGLCVSGVLRSLCLVGRAYTQHITAYMGASMAVAFITAPLLVFFYMNTNSLAEWTRVFMTSAAVIIIASTIFAIFGRGRASNWAATSWDPLISSKMRNLQPIDFSQDECGLYELRLIDPNRK
ncbi:hypothetical protein Angca_007189, partial [Angiostrongylus cantonensis]